MKNQKVGTVAGTVILVIIAVTALVFVWVYEKNLPEVSIQLSNPMEIADSLDSQASQKSVQNEPVVMVDNDLPSSMPVNLCKGFSEEPGIGESYPIAEKYSHLSFLGELFTASDCSRQRMLEVNQGTDEYTNGINLFLKTPPSNNFKTVLEGIGFSCEEDSQASCTEWSFKKPIKLQELLRLKPFSDAIDTDDCTICG